MSTTECNLVQCHPLTHKPNAVWDLLKPTQRFHGVTLPPLDLPIKDDAVRFVCISDTHSSRNLGEYFIPYGDVLLHAGDFTMFGAQQEVQSFNTFLGTLPHPHKVVVAGNHELGFDPKEKDSEDDDVQKQRSHPSQYLTNCIYLQDSLTKVYGLSIYGTPWQPEFNKWAFNLCRGLPCLKKWNQIPSGVDVLLTHTPPIGHGDMIHSGSHVGCVELLTSVQERIKPKFHVFGHIHEAYGMTTDEQTTFINCCSSTIHCQLANEPIIFDIPLPDGQKKGGQY